jgi:hypothetical protein
MRPPLLSSLAAFAALALTGCGTPNSVITLSNKTRDAVNVMGNAYVADLEQMRSYDARRVEEFNRLAHDYEERRQELAGLYKTALDHAKSAAKAQLYQEFDETVNRLLTHDFWINYRASMDAKSAARLIENKSNAAAKIIQGEKYPKDKQAETQLIITLRNDAIDSAFLVQTVDSTFARFAERINEERRKFRAETEARFAAIHLDTSRTNLTKAPELNTADASKAIEDRIANAQKLRTSLDGALNEMHTYLTSSQVPWKDFAEGALKGFIGIAENSRSLGELTGIGLPGSQNKEPGKSGFPPLSILESELLTQFAGIDKEVQGSKQDGNVKLASLRNSMTDFLGNFAPAPPSHEPSP